MSKSTSNRLILQVLLLGFILGLTEAIFTSAINNEANKLEKMIQKQLDNIQKLVGMTEDGNRHRRELISITKTQVGMIDDMLEQMKKQGKKEKRRRPSKRDKKRQKGDRDYDGE